MASLRSGGSRVQAERRHARWAASTLATLLACAACGGSDGPSPTDPSAPGSSASPGPTATSGSAEPTGPTGPVDTPATTDSGTAGPPPPATSASSTTVIADQHERVEFARRDVAERFGYPVDEIEVVAVEPVVWPNAAAGCPSTGREYEPDPTPGYRIVLAWADLTFSYHGVDGDLEPELCQFLD